jgi:hypothetical protein
LKAGGKISDFQASIDDPLQLRRIVEYVQAGAPEVPLSGYSYDAAKILQFGVPTEDILPVAEYGEVVIWYGGWSLQQLRDNPLIRERDVMWDQDWYNNYIWSSEVLPVGFYRLRIPVPNSNSKSFDEQTELLFTGEVPAHPVLVATAELCHEIQTGKSMLAGICVRTGKKCHSGLELGRDEGRLSVHRYGNDYDSNPYLASAQYCT